MSQPDDPRIGTELAGFRIERQLGRGGMGVVYLAHQIRYDRKVALKVLAPELASDEGFRERFEQEWRSAAKLEHPNIVPDLRGRRRRRGALHRHALRRRHGSRRAPRTRGPPDPGAGRSASSARSAPHSTPRTPTASSIATSSRATSCSRREPKVTNEHVYLTDFGVAKQTRHGAGSPDAGSSSGRSTTPLRSRSRARRSTAGPTSTRSAASSTSASRDRCRTRRTPRSPSSMRISTTPRPGRPSGCPSCRRRSTPWSRRHSRNHRTIATRRAETSRPERALRSGLRLGPGLQRLLRAQPRRWSIRHARSPTALRQRRPQSSRSGGHGGGRLRR